MEKEYVIIILDLDKKSGKVTEFEKYYIMTCTEEKAVEDLNKLRQSYKDKLVLMQTKD